MKLIHCADFHLDSALNANLEGEKKKLRKAELMDSFVRIAEYAIENEVDAILIAGDLFDGPAVSKRTQNIVKETILCCPAVDFLYLRGNHDRDCFLENWEDKPKNFKTFGEDWTYYRYGDTVIAGAVMTEGNSGRLCETLSLNQDDCNIVMLHGQTDKYRSAENAETVQLAGYRNKNIDYLALGHYHSYSSEILDLRGSYCYCGCPEGRGYDECGEKGFVRMETVGRKLSYSFVPFAERTIHEVVVDISDAQTTVSVEKKIAAAVEKIPVDDMVSVVLKGKVSMDAERDLVYLNRRFENSFFAFRVDDSAVGLAIRPEDYKNDVSLRGEFIRMVMESNHTDEEKRMILELGVCALAGEEAESCF